MNAANSLPHHASAGNPLCPACGSPVVRIEASVEVKYHVHYAVTACDLEVIEEQVGDGDWNEASPAACTACGWRGEVAQLLGVGVR